MSSSNGTQGGGGGGSSGGDVVAASSGSASAGPAKEKRVSDLDVSNANRGVWLVKVPKYISDRWETAEENSDVGKLKISRRPGAKPSVSFTLNDKIVAAKESSNPTDEVQQKGTDKQIPQEHKFVIGTVASQTLAVFSHTPSDPEAVLPTPDRLCLEGKVVQRAECRPISDKIYMILKKEAIINAIEPTRKTMQLDKAVNAYKPKSNHASNIAYEAKKKAEGRKARDDKEKIMEILFALFEKHQYYNIKDLVKETRQPVTYLKEILKDVCSYNLKNPHKNMWELKPEYRHYKADEDKKGKEEAGGNKSSSDEDD